MKVGEAYIIAQVDSVRIVVEHFGRSYMLFPIGSPNIYLDPSNHILDLTVVPPPHDEATDLP